MTKKGKICVGEDFRIAVTLVLQKFRQTEDQKEFEFPSSLTSVERAYVHRYCLQLGFKSKSRGDGANRYLTVYKKEGSTIVQADAVFELGRISRQHTVGVLQRFPVSARERQELLPPTERDRVIGQETTRDVNRTTGRLTNGIPQIPTRRLIDSEYSAFRQTLPIWKSKDEIMQAILRHQVVIISGETGSGKTTQVPQLILDHCAMTGQACRIICTQPRRLAALSVAERVALERDDKVGQSVGYQIRLESRVSPKTLLTFCTNGVLLRTLMGGDASIATVTHIIVDELHERDRFSDFLIAIMRDLLLKFRNLKLILMSAALDTQLFVKYFGNCPVIEVPGRTYEVKTYFLEDLLKLTGYFTKTMLKYKNEAEKRKAKQQQLDSWCSSLMPSTSNSASGSGSADTSLQNNNNSIDSSENMHADMDFITQQMNEKLDLEPHLSAAMDQAIQNAWLTGTEESLATVMNIIISEKVSVDYQHSETSISALMIAAGRGHFNTVEQLLALGASVHLRASNDWTAVDWAKHFGNAEIQALLEANWCNGSSYQREKMEMLESGTEVSEEDKHLLDIYHHSRDDEKVDLDLILCLLQKLCSNPDDAGSILIFLPGYDDIVSLRDKILNDEQHFSDKNRFVLFTLHSHMQSSDQKRVFKPAPPGTRKIVLATNIAETSITINDIVYVIDSGKVKEKSYDALSGVTQLKAGWVSQASAIQRRGRAGRCRPGICYHLISQTRFSSLHKFQVPEILRVPIHELCLQAKLLAPPNIPIADFLARAPDPPAFMVTRNAVTLLKTIDALDPWEELTELGLHLLDLPIEPRLGKMVLYSVVLKCLDPILTIVCSLACRDPFLLPSKPADKRASSLAKKKFAADTYSDHMALLRAFQAWQKAKAEGYEHSFSEKSFLSVATMEMTVGMRTQLLGQLRASGFVRARGGGDIRDLNTNSENWAVVKAALCAGTYPNLIRVDRERKQLITQKESKVRFHQSSVLNRLPTSSKQTVSALHSKVVSDLPCDWLLYEEMTRTGHIAHAHCCTLLSPITVALFAGPARLPLDAVHEPDHGRLEGYAEDSDSEVEVKSDSQKAMFKLDDWVSFRVEPEVARLTLQLRQKWHALFLRRMHAPAKPWSQVDEAVVRAVVGVVSSEEQALGLHQPPGIGQRPRPMATESCASISIGAQQPSSPKSGCYGHQNLYMSSDMHGKQAQSRGSDERSDSSSVRSAGSGSGSNPMSPCASPSPSTCTSVQQISSKTDCGVIGGIASRVRYFVIKANTPRALDVSMARGVWAFTPTTERKLLSASKEGKEVVLIFSVQGSGHFQGYARFSPSSTELRLPEFVAPNLGPCYQVEWIKRANIPFQSTRHLLNSWNENRKVQISRDGQELEPCVGDALCKLWDKFPLYGTKPPSVGRHMVYSHDSITPADPNIAHSSQISPLAWYDTHMSGPSMWGSPNN